jgi:hypothetical protein
METIDKLINIGHKYNNLYKKYYFVESSDVDRKDVYSRRNREFSDGSIIDCYPGATGNKCIDKDYSV